MIHGLRCPDGAHPRAIFDEAPGEFPREADPIDFCLRPLPARPRDHLDRPQLLTCLLGRLGWAGPDVEDPAGPSDGHVTNTQVAITECDPTADPNDVSMRLEQIAKPGRAVEVNREAGREQ